MFNDFERCQILNWGNELFNVLIFCKIEGILRID